MVRFRIIRATAVRPRLTPSALCLQDIGRTFRHIYFDCCCGPAVLCCAARHPLHRRASESLGRRRNSVGAGTAGWVQIPYRKKTVRKLCSYQLYSFRHRCDLLHFQAPFHDRHLQTLHPKPGRLDDTRRFALLGALRESNLVR